MRPNDLQIGTLGGTLCSLWATINFGDLIQTLIAAALGSLISYAVSALLSRFDKNK